MKLYIVFYEFGHESHYFEKVFLSKEKAQEYIEKQNTSEYEEYVIEEHIAEE